MSDVLTEFLRDTEDAKKWVNQTSGTVPTRLGSVLTPLPVRDQQFADAIASTGWFIIGTFAAGFTYTAGNQVGTDANGNQWSYNGSLPFTVTAGTVPSSPDYTNRGDAALRSDLAASDSTVLVGGVEAGVVVKGTDIFGNVSGLTSDQVKAFYATNPPMLRGNVNMTGNVLVPDTINVNELVLRGIPMRHKFNNAGQFAQKPSWFNWDIGAQFWLDHNGHLKNNLDLSQYDVASQNPNATVVYVDGVNGVLTVEGASNPGTDPLTPTVGINNVWARVNDGTYGAITDLIVLVAPGYYKDDKHWSVAAPTGLNISVKKWGESSLPVISATEQPSFTWTSVGSGTFSTTRSAVGAVVDESVINKYGDWTMYPKVANLAACQALAGSWAQDGATLYVHALNGSQPDASVHIYTTKVNGAATTGNYSLFVQDIWFYGGTAGFNASSTDVTTTERVTLHRCKAAYTSGNGMECFGASYFTLIDCQGFDTQADIYNYHGWVSGGVTQKISRVLEINCIGRNAGQAWSATLNNHNISTGHDGCYIARFGGAGFGSRGPLCIDVNACLSWSFACNYTESKGPSGTTNCNMFFNGNGGKSLVDCCTADGSDYSVISTDGCDVYVRRSYVEPKFLGAEFIHSFND